MTDDAFEQLEDALRSGGAQAAFDFLAQKLGGERKHAELFELRLMKKRHELGLPLIPVDPNEGPTEETRRAYDEAIVQAAREAGSLFLADGDIERAWPYFRAIGETAPVAAAIEQVQPREGIDRIIEIALFERANPRKGFELLLANYGLCKAITTIMQNPERNGREDCIRLLLHTLHADLVRSLKRAIVQQEGEEPSAESVAPLIAGRDWLFENNNYYLDTSHVASVLQLSVELKDSKDLALALELAQYGSRLSPLFQFRGTPPFEDVFRDHALYLQGLLGQDVDRAIAHFRKKADECDPKQAGNVPAQVLVGLFARLGRYNEAMEVFLECLTNSDSSQLACPSLFQLCKLAGDYNRLMKLARERGDLLNFTAAALKG